MKLLDVHPEEIARQLTLIEHSLYRAIKPSECLKQRWTTAAKASVAPNVIALIERFNKVEAQIHAIVGFFRLLTVFITFLPAR